MKSVFGAAAGLLMMGSGAALAQDAPPALRIVDSGQPASGQSGSPLDRAEPGASALRPANNPGAWIMDTDYPSSAIMNNEEGTVSFSLDVAPDGTVSGCEITGGSAPANLKQLTCKLITLRALFVPKRDDQGRAVEGVFDGSVRWQIPEGRRPAPQESTWDYAFTVEPDGSVSDCQIDTLTGVERYWACGFPEGIVFEPMVDDDGNPVRRRVRMRGSVTIEDFED